jgi:transcriptional regulator with XRE-family HTH domain
LEYTAIVTVKRAIATLRSEIGITQQQLAQKLGVTVTTVSRYENGREPRREILEVLAALAESAGIGRLRDFFETKRRAAIVARIHKLPSSGTQRRISLDDLKYWSAYLNMTARDITKLHIEDPVAKEYLRNAAFVMSHVRDKIEVYVDEPRSSTRLQEDQEILRDHWINRK